MAAALLMALTDAHATDWPEWRGEGRRGVWTETGILETLPAKLDVTWRTTIHAGYSGPAIADGRIVLTDFRKTSGSQGRERALALDEKTGEVLWTHEWQADYTGLMAPYDLGPRATPTVDGDRVHVLGAMGHLFTLAVSDGRVLWKKDLVAEYGTTVPVWGMTGAPLVDGDRLIVLVGGESNARVVAFDRTTGKEVWRALGDGSEPGYNSPVLIEAGGMRQVIIWHPEAVSALDPASGKVVWEVPFAVRMGLTVATPVFDETRLLVSSFYDGARMLALDRDKPVATLTWAGTSSSEIETDTLHALITTPVLDGDFVYGVGSYGQLRCLDAKTGKRVWESQEAVVEKARWAAAFLVRHEDHYFISNDRGELIMARLSPGGYEELSRTELIAPTSAANRRARGNVHWSHPAYASRHIVVRNDNEILRASLTATLP